MANNNKKIIIAASASGVALGAGVIATAAVIGKKSKAAKKKGQKKEAKIVTVKYEKRPLFDQALYVNLVTDRYHRKTCRYCKIVDNDDRWRSISSMSEKEFDIDEHGNVLYKGRTFVPCSFCKPEMVWAEEPKTKNNNRKENK